MLAGRTDEEETKSAQSQPTDTTAASEMEVPEPTQAEMAELKIMRMGFQDIGPTVTNLEQFIGVEHIVLSGNCISEILPSSFRTNVNLQFLSLAKNKLTTIEHLGHLEQLQYLDLSSNLIEAVPDLNALPVNLLSLKLIDNPIERQASESGKLSAYRKPFVLHLSQLEDMDKLEILAAERMSYLGTLPRRVNIDEMLRKKKQEDEIRKQGFKLQNELRVEIQREQGKENKEILTESLNEFAKMDEMDSWLDNMGEMMTRQEDR